MMSWQDVRHWYEERDDPEPAPPVKIVCGACHRVVDDPPDAVRTEEIDDCSAACRAERLAWEERRHQEEREALAAVWAEESRRVEAEESAWEAMCEASDEAKAREALGGPSPIDPYGDDEIPW